MPPYCPAGPMSLHMSQQKMNEGHGAQRSTEGSLHRDRVTGQTSTIPNQWHSKSTPQPQPPTLIASPVVKPLPHSPSLKASPRLICRSLSQKPMAFSSATWPMRSGDDVSFSGVKAEDSWRLGVTLRPLVRTLVCHLGAHNRKYGPVRKWERKMAGFSAGRD